MTGMVSGALSFSSSTHRLHLYSNLVILTTESAIEITVSIRGFVASRTYVFSGPAHAEDDPAETAPGHENFRLIVSIPIFSTCP